MAVKWAVANGNWSDGTTWNDGVVPTSYDIVYCNGHTINITWTTIIVNELHNDANADYNIIAGGELKTPNSSGALTFIGNIYANGEILSAAPVLKRSLINITGNIHNFANSWAVIAYNQSAATSAIVNGNLYGNYCIGDYYGGSIEINGSLIPDNASLPMVGLSTHGESPAYNVIINSSCDDITVVMHGRTAASSIGRIEIRGNVVEDSNRLVYGANVSEITNFIVNGDYTNRRAQYYTVTNFTIGGSIYYVGTNNMLGVRYTNINILNPDIFTWKDITEPRSNPFIIVTNADMNNRQQYPAEDEVKEGTEYVWGEKVGTYQQPPESVVLKDYVYDNGDKIGSLENQNIVGCVTPEDVRKDVSLVGMGVVGSLVVPSVDDVREGVVFDNGSVGTLIVQGGGDRLRIADFGYYTRSTSITYIVDLTESDKPAFADCEEIVLRSLFPTLDLDNIPDKFFDDLFVQFLRYRLLVEYYRGTSINSKFTPSEPTAEIVNYANTKCEYWLNTANLFLQLWGEKYPNSVKKDRFLL